MVCYSRKLVVFSSLVHLWAILQQWNFSLAPNAQGLSSTPVTQTPQAVSKLAHVPASSDVSQPSVVELKSSARKELPAVIGSL